MNAEQTTGRVWNRRRTEKQRRLAEAKISGKVIPTDQLVAVLEHLLAPATGWYWKATTRNRQISSHGCWRRLTRKNSRPAYDYAERRAQRAPDLFEKASPASSISPSPAPKVCAFRSCWKMACWKSARFTPISSFTLVCTSTCRRTSR